MILKPSCLPSLTECLDMTAYVRFFIIFSIAVVSTIRIVDSDDSIKEVRTEVRVGEVYPQIVLPSLIDGKPMSLSDFRGKKIILHQFASW